mgnify:CR=1 FL=1
MGYHYIRVTPKMAAAFLERNTSNRAIRSSHLEYLTQLILDGEWRKTGEAIRFSGNYTNGKSVLLDGQHRLQSLINSGKSSLMIEIIDDLPDDSFQFMDQGRPRSAPDVLSWAQNNHHCQCRQSSKIN